MDSLGDRISNARSAKGMTQADVAKRMSYSVSLISFWETGRATPSKKQLKRLEKILGKLDPPSVGEWLRNERNSKNLSQKELAKLAGVSSQTISNTERNYTEPQQNIVDRLRKALNVSIPEEIEDAVEKSEDSSTPGVSDAKSFDPFNDSTWPEIGGIYVFFDEANRPIYIGQSNSIGRRIKDHSDRRWYFDPVVKSGKYVEIEDETLRRNVEKILIKLVRSYTIFNKQHR